MPSAPRLSPEFALAAACCRWPASAARDAAIRSAAARVGDWALFARLLKRHRIEALAQASMAATDLDIPQEVSRVLADRAALIARRSLAMATESARLQGVFDAAGIRVLLLKGAALAHKAYGSVALKFSQDIDLLVTRDRAVEALHLLQAEGYALQHPAAALDARQMDVVLRYGREVALRARQRAIRVELRWQAVKSPALLDGVDAGAPVQAVDLSDNNPVRTFADADLFAYLCVHGAGHGWARLQWLADLNAFLSLRDDAAVVALYRHAQAKGAGPCAVLALTLCGRVFERPLPELLAREWRGNVRLTWLVALALSAMRAPTRPSAARIVLIQFLLSSDRRHIAALLRDLAFRPGDMIAHPLPRPLHCVYPVLRMPLWLWRRLA